VVIEVGFSIILGFGITSTLCGLLADGSRGDRIVVQALICSFILFCFVGYYQGETVGFFGLARWLVVSSFSQNIIWLSLGAAIAIFAQLVAEGHAYDLWVKFHPQSAPTPEARFGQRAQPIGRSKPIAATLVGTSTEYLNSELDLKTDTLIRLCFYTFEDRGAFTLSRLESSLRLGTGRRQKAFHKLAAGLPKRPKLKPTLHRYCRSINGSSRLSQALFEDLCRLAHDTGNRDFSTIDRLILAGRALGVSEPDVRRLISRSR